MNPFEQPPAPPKAPPPPLTARAPRPRAVRIRKPAVQAAALAASALLAGSFAWAFVLEPRLKAAARDRDEAAREAPAGRGSVRPPELIASGPAAYDRLPPPRLLAPPPPEAPESGLPASRAPRAARPSAPRRPDPGRSPSAQAAASDLFFGGAGEPPAGPAGAAGDGAGTYNPHRLEAPRSPWELKAGTLIPAVLLTGVDTARTGPVAAVVDRPVRDTVSGRRILVPQGSRLIGRHEGASVHGDRRAYLVWDRLILPDGRSIRLEGEPAVDPRGAVGAPGTAERRLWPMAVASLLAGAITAVGEFARGGADDHDGGSLLGTAGDAASLEAAAVGGRLIDRELDARAAVRVPPGAPVRVLITRDLVLEPWTS